MRGYLNNPQATAQSMTSDGYFKTGDIAIYDDQTFLFKIVGRLKVSGIATNLFVAKMYSRK